MSTDAWVMGDGSAMTVTATGDDLFLSCADTSGCPGAALCWMTREEADRLTDFLTGAGYGTEQRGLGVVPGVRGHGEGETDGGGAGAPQGEERQRGLVGEGCFLRPLQGAGRVDGISAVEDWLR